MSVRARGVGLAAASGVLLAGLGYVQPFLAWLAFVPLLIAARRTRPGAAIGLPSGRLVPRSAPRLVLEAGVCCRRTCC
jgi:hypothetical protein